MSYSFAVRAATKAEAREKIAAQFDQVEIAQPCHMRDRAAVQALAFAFVDLLPDDDSRDVRVTCNGHMVGPWPLEKNDAKAINACVYAELIAKE